MRLTVNAQPHELPDGSTVADLLAHLGLKDRPVAVEVNRQLIPKRRHQEHRLSPEDQVELVTLVGGG